MAWDEVSWRLFGNGDRSRRTMWVMVRTVNLLLVFRATKSWILDLIKLNQTPNNHWKWLQRTMPHWREIIKYVEKYKIMPGRQIFTLSKENVYFRERDYTSLCLSLSLSLYIYTYIHNIYLYIRKQDSHQSLKLYIALSAVIHLKWVDITRSLRMCHRTFKITDLWELKDNYSGAKCPSVKSFWLAFKRGC